MTRDKKAVVLFPWGMDCVRDKSNGAGLRVALLNSFLASRGFDVHCVSVGWKEKTLTIDEDVTLSNRRIFSGWGYLLYGFSVKLAAWTKWVFPIALLQFLVPRLSHNFSKVCKELLLDADAIFLEYPFWMKPLRKIVGDKNIILTNHDQTWVSMGSTGLFQDFQRDILKSLEMDAMTLADHVVVTSQDDAVAFEELGFSSTVVPNSIEFPCSPEKEEKAAFVNKWGKWEKEKAVLFVGGGWYPNVKAAKVICEIIAPEMQNYQFFLVGRCCDRIQKSPDNVTLAGMVTNIELNCFYDTVEYVFIPIEVGTGSSLKTVEALSYGKVIVSTKKGARGLSLESGRHIVIEDDFSRYPRHVSELNNTLDARHRLEAESRQFANQYNYETTYLKYLDCCE